MASRTVPPPAPPAPPDEQAIDIGGIASMLLCSRRQVERLKTAGRLPKPDFTVGRLPRWWPSTIRRWVAEGGPK